MMQVQSKCLYAQLVVDKNARRAAESDRLFTEPGQGGDEGGTSGGTLSTNRTIWHQNALVLSPKSAMTRAYSFVAKGTRWVPLPFASQASTTLAGSKQAKMETTRSVPLSTVFSGAIGGQGGSYTGGRTGSPPTKSGAGVPKPTVRQGPGTTPDLEAGGNGFPDIDATRSPTGSPSSPAAQEAMNEPLLLIEHCITWLPTDLARQVQYCSAR